MIKESKYILRKILIGVGIVISLSFIKSCNVKALTLMNGVEITNPPQFIIENNYPFYISNWAGNTYRLIYTTQPNLIVNNNSVDGSFNPFINGSGVYELNGSYDSNTNTISGNWGGSPSSNIIYWNSLSCTSSSVYFNKTIYKQNGTVSLNPENYSCIVPLQPPQPIFISFNANSISTDNVITGYILQPEFSLFDSDNYSYEYSFDSNRWLILNQNEQLLRVNTNTTIYIRIKDKNNNEIISNSSFTITNIGSFYNEETYDITFSGEYRTENYLNNSISSKSQSIIKEYQIYIDYKPKTSILTYQYQFVTNNSSLDNNNWQNVPVSDEGSKTYVANVNGVLYARILDNDENVLKTATFTVNSIGLLALDNNESKIDDFYTKLRNKVNFTGPVSSLINIPIQLINTISDGLSNSNSCVDYSLGSLWGTNLVLPCVNIKQHLGNSLYNIIDLIIACCMIYHIIKMFGNLYTNLLFLHEYPMKDLGRRGD